MAEHAGQDRGGVAERDSDAHRERRRNVPRPAPEALPLVRHLKPQQAALGKRVEGHHREGGGGEDGNVEERHLPEPGAHPGEEHRRHQQAQDRHQRIGEVAREVEEGLRPNAQRERRRQDLRQQLPGGLERSLGPAALLRLEGVHGDREFGRGGDLGHENELPVEELGPVGEVEVLGEGVSLPASSVLDRRPPPDARRSVEVEEAPRHVASAVLGHEVAVQQDGLHVGEERVVAVQVVPAGLHEAGPPVGEQVGERPPQEVGPGDEVGVEDGHEGGVGGVEARLEGPRLETAAVRPVDPANVEPGGGALLHDRVGDPSGVVGGVIEQLHGEPRPGIVQRRHRPDQPFHDVALVEHRELKEHPRRVALEERGAAGPQPLRRRRGAGRMAGQPVDQHVPVGAIDRQQQQDDEIGRQHGVGEGQAGAL